VPGSFKWYQALFGQPATPPAHDYFGQILDSDGTVLLCLHKWGAHEHPSLISPDHGAPSITVSALSRDTSSAPVAIPRLASVLASGFAFPLVEGFGFGVAFVFLLIRPRLAFRIVRWKTGSTNHLSGHLTSDHDSWFELADFLGEARRPISPTMNYSFTRVAHGLPCMRTSCAYPAWLRNIQYIRTANFLAIATRHSAAAPQL
jgi:hypothetical protein